MFFFILRKTTLKFYLYFWNYIQDSAIAFLGSYIHSRTMNVVMLSLHMFLSLKVSYLYLYFILFIYIAPMKRALKDDSNHTKY